MEKNKTRTPEEIRLLSDKPYYLLSDLQDICGISEETAECRKTHIVKLWQLQKITLYVPQEFPPEMEETDEYFSPIEFSSMFPPLEWDYFQNIIDNMDNSSEVFDDPWMSDPYLQHLEKLQNLAISKNDFLMLDKNSGDIIC